MSEELLTIILDIDGVLITTPLWKPDPLHVDGYSDFCERCVQCFNKLTEGILVEIILSSSRRKTKTLEEWNQIFSNRGMKTPITEMFPVLESATNRREEIEIYLEHKKLKNYLIIDDDLSLHEITPSIRHRCIITTYVSGFNEKALADAELVMGKKKFS